MIDGTLTWYIILCYIVTVIGGFIPLFLKFMPNKKLAGNILDVCSAAAGGLFLSGGLIHMLAEGNELLVDSGYTFGGLPLAFFLCGITFLLVFFFDRVVADHDTHASFAEHAERLDAEDKKPLLIPDEENPIEINTNTINTNNDNNNEQKDSSIILDNKNNTMKNNQHYTIQSSEDDSSFEDQLKQKGWCSIITLVFALTLHSFFEGLGLGAASDPLPIFIAVCAHKWADSGFTVIFLMTKIKSVWGVSLIVIIFSSFTPVGALIGVFIMEWVGESEISNLIQGILITLASGTFLYVSVIEIFAEQFENGRHKYLKFFLGVILFLAMSFTTFFE